MARFGPRASSTLAAWQRVLGDDDEPAANARVALQHQVWQEMVAKTSTEAFQDPDFRPGPRAIDGRREEVSSSGDFFKATMSEVLRKVAPQDGKDVVLCHCGLVCEVRHVQKKGSTRAALELQWRRFAATGDWKVVCDEGFRPSDVRQGGVGDCWFMSALAVVAERHDLMRKLLPNLNEGAESGCHEVRLFLDGHWTALLVDDWLPTTEKQRRPDGTSLAYARCARQQLWVSFIEKAYAKAHGAYRFISGGETSEALLELTGAPTEVVNFQDPTFDPELFWARLVSLLQVGCPIGCGTSALTLEELGLVGQHAYSVLAAEDGEGLDSLDGLGGLSSLDYSERVTSRHVKVRNPWGEWTRREQDELLAQLGVAIIPSDGCFWMNYQDFIRGFACCDICYARDGWHGRSFDLAFDTTQVGSRSVLRLKAPCSGECWIMGIQPTERGKQIKRPPGYYLNDLSLLILDDSAEVVASFLGGARRDVSCSVMMEAGREYVAIPLSFRATKRGPFVLRVYAASPVEALLEAPSPELTWHAMHSLLMAPKPKTQKPFQRMAYDFGAGQVVVIEADFMALGLVVNRNPFCLEVDFHAAGNHTVLRSQSGLLDGREDQQRNQRHQAAEAKAKAKMKSHVGKPNWQLFEFNALVPKYSQALAFVAVAQLETWEFSLESMEAQQSLESPPAMPSSSPFAAVASEERLEELEDLELQAALLASQVDTEVSANMDEDDLELALRLSMEALPQVVCNRWSRRKAAAKIRARWEPGGRG
ncbi:unnamed protein product [Durusdinium trenchii]|uniref:Calpain catalytic domain-containing protein n=1 Tax=Durusdinium trenchii TaxID=1381693 RepID=A0ABP0NAK8_9DINO